MSIQRTRKTYPLLKWLLLAAVALAVLGLVQSKVLTDPNDADKKVLIYWLIPAAILPFLALAMPRRRTEVIELPTDQLAKSSRQELQGILDQLEKAHAKGEIPDDRYQKARDRILKQVNKKPQ